MDIVHRLFKPIEYIFFFFLRYENLCEFFNCLDGSIRLLRLKGSMPTFTNICPKIECLTDRYFHTFLHCCKYSKKILLSLLLLFLVFV